MRHEQLDRDSVLDDAAVKAVFSASFPDLQPLVEAVFRLRSRPRACGVMRMNDFRGDIWKHARVTTLVLCRRNIRTRQGLQRVKKLTEYQLDFLMADSDTPTTRTKFQVIVDVPCDPEHKVCSTWFRDGALTSFGAGA